MWFQGYVVPSYVCENVLLTTKRYLHNFRLAGTEQSEPPKQNAAIRVVCKGPKASFNNWTICNHRYLQRPFWIHNRALIFSIVCLILVTIYTLPENLRMSRRQGPILTMDLKGCRFYVDKSSGSEWRSAKFHIHDRKTDQRWTLAHEMISE